MGSLRFGACLGIVAIISFFLFLPACSYSKPAGASPFAGRITLNPSSSFSMQVGSSLLLTASAQNSSGTAITPTFTFASSNPGILDIAPNGFACAGTWNAPVYSICTPAGIGTVQVTASALGATSPPTLFFVHPPLDNIKISVTPPVNSPPPACPSQVALPAACNLKFNPTSQCLSPNQAQILQATAYSQGVDVTASVGPFTWTPASPSVVKVAPLVNPDLNVVTYQATVTPSAPGQTQIIASASGVFSQPFNFETCPIQCITLQVGSQNSTDTSFSVTKGASETITATAVDVQGCIVPKAPLTWVSSSPTAIAASCTLGSTTCTVTTPQPGTAAITATCTPPTCNTGFPLNPSANSAPFVPQPVYPVTAISGLSTGSPVATSVVATTQDCSSDAFCNVGIYNVSTSTNLPGGASQSTTPPNSLMFDAAGDRAFMGSEFGALLVTPGNIGGASSPFTSLSASGTPLGLVTGKILATSSSGGVAIFSDTVSTPNQVYVVSASPSSTTALNINSAIAAAVSPDGLKAFILGNGGNTLYVYSTLQALQTFPLAAPATSVVFNSTGSYALLAGGSSPTNLAIRNTCDNSAVNLPITAPGLPGPPLFLKMVPPGNVPMGNTIIPIPLMTDGLDFFFGLDNTGIDIIATTSSLLPLPLPAGPLTIPNLCPRPIVLAQTATNPATTFEPIHINIGFGTFHPINFFLSPDTSLAYIVTTDFGVLIYSFNTGSVSRIQLVNDAAPVAADVSSDRSLIYVAGSDGLLHELNTATGLDQNQTSFISLPNSTNDFCFTQNNCSLNLIAVKP